MSIPELRRSEQITKPHVHPFLSELHNIEGRELDFSFLMGAFIAQLDFIIQRPLMEMANSSDFAFMLDRIKQEKQEYLEEVDASIIDKNKAMGELCDICVFGLSVVIDMWSELEEDQKQELIGCFEFAQIEAEKLGFNPQELDRAIIGVISNKNALNLPAKYLSMNLNGFSRKAFLDVYLSLREYRNESESGVLPPNFSSPELEAKVAVYQQMAY